jgi:hypothetical protein
MRNLGDLVVMPLPTEWAPEQPGTQTAYQQPLYGPFPFQGAGSAVPGVLPPGGVPGALANAPPMPSGGPGGLTWWPPSAQPPAGNWAQQMLPDSVLPRPLQRTNPLLRRLPVEWTPGPWDMRLLREAQLWTFIKNHGGLKSCCYIPELGAPLYNQPPWIVMPSNASKFEQGFGVATPAGPFSGLDVLLGQFQVPDGWDGVITRFVPNFTGLGFQDYSGNIFWRLKVGNRFAPDLGNVNTTFGSLNQVSVPGINNIRLISGQNVQVYFNIPLGSPVATGMITAAVFGWFYPRR